MNSLCSYFYFEDFSDDALGLANVLARFVDGDAIGRVKTYREEEWGQEREKCRSAGERIGARCRALPRRTAGSLP